MPELPEVETIVRELKPRLSGKTIENIDVLWPRTVGGDMESFAHILSGKVIRDINRRGKYICFSLDNRLHLTVHLRMTGKFVFNTDEKERNHIRVIFHFNHSSPVYFVDTRKFGRMKLWLPGEELLPHLGPEPLEEKTVYPVLSNLQSRRSIKTLLLDQEILAGIGNIYADEALYKAGIHPLTAGNRVSKIKARALSRALPELLLAAVENKGTTISDYRTTDHSKGENQNYLNVYGRTGQPCYKCGTAIQRIIVNQRGSHFCPRCQRVKK